MATSKKTKKIPYMQTVKADVTLRFVGPKENKLELSIVLPKRMGQILIRRLRKRVK